MKIVNESMSMICAGKFKLLGKLTLIMCCAAPGTLKAVPRFGLDEESQKPKRMRSSQLNENTKPQAAKAIIVCYTKVGRALALFNRHGELLLMKQWDKENTQVHDVQQDPYLSDNVDLSKLESVEDKCQAPSIKPLHPAVKAMINCIMGLP